jgi:hypothetical protein
MDRSVSCGVQCDPKVLLLNRRRLFCILVDVGPLLRFSRDPYLETLSDNTTHDVFKFSNMNEKKVLAAVALVLLENWRHGRIVHIAHINLKRCDLRLVSRGVCVRVQMLGKPSG